MSWVVGRARPPPWVAEGDAYDLRRDVGFIPSRFARPGGGRPGLHFSSELWDFYLLQILRNFDIQSQIFFHEIAELPRGTGLAMDQVRRRRTISKRA